MRINLNRKIVRRADGFPFANVRKGKIDVVCVCQCGSVAKLSFPSTLWILESSNPIPYCVINTKNKSLTGGIQDVPKLLSNLNN